MDLVAAANASASAATLAGRRASYNRAMIPSSDTDPPTSQRWAAVCARDARADGLFIFAVRTTGVFCRPACPARRPQRANVVFFDTPAAAVLAGFRACKRCAPEASSSQAQQLALIDRACRLIERALPRRRRWPS